MPVASLHERSAATTAEGDGKTLDLWMLTQRCRSPQGWQRTPGSAGVPAGIQDNGPKARPSWEGGGEGRLLW
jgi:hypothetical protein